MKATLQQMNSISGKINTIANVMIIVLALYYGGYFLKQHVLRSRGPNSEKALKNHLLNVGDSILLPGMDWSKQSKTVVLAISPSCEFCGKNASLYRFLSQMIRKRNDIKLLPLLPDSSSGGEAFLDELGIEVEEIRKASFKEIGIDGTPTLMLINSQGIVSKVWVGALNPSQEAEVLNSLEEDSVVSYISVGQLKKAIDDGENLVVVDIGDRESYALEHISTAKNIPIDELQSRVLQELPVDSRIVLYCACPKDDLGRIAIDILDDTLRPGANVSVLKGGLNAWRSVGLPTINKQLTKYNQ